MTWRTIAIWGGPLAAIGALVFVAGGSVAMCLGPLSVTVASCAKATGVLPNPGLGGSPVALAFAIAALWAAPVGAAVRGRVAMLAVAGMAIGVVAYDVARPRTLEGWTHALPSPGITDPGPWIVLPWPFDPASAVGAACLAGAVVLFAGAIVSDLASRRRAGRTAPDG